MKKFMFLLVAMAFIAFGYNGAFAARMDKSMGRDARDVSAWVGKEVRNPQGQKLGKVTDYVRDDRGEVSLLIVSHGGFAGIGAKKVAVPFDAFSFNERGNDLVLNATKQQLDNAPAIGNEDLTDPAFAQEMHRYFGERSRWSDEGTRPRGYLDHDRFDNR